MNDNWVETLPTGFMSQYLTLLMHLGELPTNAGTRHYSFLQYFEAMGRKIQKANGKLLRAKTRDDIVTAESQKKAFTTERERILSLTRKYAAHFFLKGTNVCVGYLDGRKEVIPKNAWSGKPNWEEGSLLFNGKTYSQISVVTEKRLPEKKWQSVKEIAGTEPGQRITRTGAAGRPSSMHIVEMELRRRLEQKEAERSMLGESRYLASWLRDTHPDLPPATPKSIANKLGKIFRELRNGKELPKI